MSSYHTSALLKECIEFLDVKKGHWYIDATLGGGGHTEGILRKGGNVVGIDTDEDSIRFVEEHFKNYVGEGRLILVNRNFSDIEEIAEEFCPSAPEGVLFDLGVSSHQLDSVSRGFSFDSANKLDMRMDKSLAVTAKDLVNGLSKKELEQLFREYGEEIYAGKIAQSIVNSRKVREISTCKELSRIVSFAKSGRGKVHPATKVFQALRVAVNDELQVLSTALPRAFRVLAPKGRILVISFHSLEDRIVKNFGNKTMGLEVLTKSPIIPSDSELLSNIRIRSAKLRVFEKN